MTLARKMNSYYFSVEGSSEGPVEHEALQKLLDGGAIPKTTVICKEGDDSWIPITEVFTKTSDVSSSSADPADETDEPPQKRAFGPEAWILLILLLAFLYVNRSAILPPPKSNDGERRAPAIDVRPAEQDWEYSVRRYGNSKAGDPDDRVVIRSYDDAELATSVEVREEELNRLGSMGWELVSVYLEMETAFYNFGASDLHTGIKPNVRPQSVVAIFKRPKR